MATVEFEPGDFFKFAEGYGVVLETGALLIIGSGGRKGRFTKKVIKVPEDALPVQSKDDIAFEINFAAEAIMSAIWAPFVDGSPSELLQTDAFQKQRVATLIMSHLETGCKDDSGFLNELRGIGENHDPACALGATPACTCGSKEAADYFDLVMRVTRVNR